MAISSGSGGGILFRLGVMDGVITVGSSGGAGLVGIWAGVGSGSGVGVAHGSRRLGNWCSRWRGLPGPGGLSGTRGSEKVNAVGSGLFSGSYLVGEVAHCSWPCGWWR